ncbi:MAG TPA: hypothetical protein VII22_17575 [Streptosporangiaceae bacterium]
MAGIPQRRIGGQHFQGQGDQPGGEAIHRWTVVSLRAAWRLVVGMAHLTCGQTIEAGHVHAVIVDEMQPAIIGDQQIPILQISVSDARSR